ncbi:MAG TPA: serine hydrolase domain-containing protein [Ktedonobacteraceae bacterium]|nr:serine hydrolase domain-containing protein [Ktedonobacteraceae bacterium]
MQNIQNHIQLLLEELVEKKMEDGLQVAVYLHGQPIVNAYAGLADPVTARPVDASTLFIGMSTTKALTATVIHQLAQAGKLSYDDTIATYWPEFAANGKAGITIRQVLCHTAGIPQLSKHVTAAMLLDWDRMIREMEQLKPLWVPGTKTGYHALTFGWILAEVAQRIDGRPFARIIYEDISLPLKLGTELFLGVAEQEVPRIARVNGGTALIWRFLPNFLLLRKTIPAHLAPMSNPHWDQSAFQRAIIPAGNAILTANALARFYAALIGEVDGVCLLSSDQLARATALQTAAPDKVFMGQRIPKSLGYWLGGSLDVLPALGDIPGVFGHPGTGGLLGFADPAHHLTFALVKNRLTFRENDTDTRIANAVRKALGITLHKEEALAKVSI